MASDEQQFPPQKQESRPGKEHDMVPAPQTINPDYIPANRLKGKVALVTGGDSGIGKAVCCYFALEGATVAFTYVNSHEESDAFATLKILMRLKTSGAKDPIAIPADLGFEENCRKVVDEVIDAFGRIDVLVNNAAEQHEKSSNQEISEELLERVFRTNVFAYFFLSKHVLKHMGEGGSIINTTSVNAYKGNPRQLEYTSTKGAIGSFTRGLALQLVEKGIRVNGVASGPVWTPLIVASLSKDSIPSFGTEVPLGRAAQPHEIAPSFVFLASNHLSSYFTGQVLHPNGGAIVNS
ncbi:NADPH-dependent aldehyde reductase 1, chloroplastic-like [Aristolochia californica]|uniref:NADPH-dependent aldehyde reductase 1, chloroplastic-like n=1 Tax=Aristolochia californica TaxID=171875 RepID=UPI0035D84B90